MQVRSRAQELGKGKIFGGSVVSERLYIDVKQELKNVYIFK